MCWRSMVKGCGTTSWKETEGPETIDEVTYYHITTVSLLHSLIIYNSISLCITDAITNLLFIFQPTTSLYQTRPYPLVLTLTTTHTLWFVGDKIQERKESYYRSTMVQWQNTRLLNYNSYGFYMQTPSYTSNAFLFTSTNVYMLNWFSLIINTFSQLRLTV